jgi:hypothetical protein
MESILELNCEGKGGSVYVEEDKELVSKNKKWKRRGTT